MKLRKQWGLLLITGLSLLAYGGMVRMQWLYGTLRDNRTPETIGWYLLAFGAYLGAIVWAEKRGMPSRWMWGGAILFRLLLLFTTPSLSDDVYRYIWDGYIANQGISPYAYAINSPELDYLDVPVRALVNNPWMASPYLPAAQGVFSSITAVFPLRPLFMQAVMVIFELLSAWLLARLLAIARLPVRRLLIYLWNPLIIVEVAHNAHLDAWMVLLMLLSLYFTFVEHGRNSAASRWLAPFYLALATLTKILPALLFPILFWQWRWRQRLAYGLFTLGLLLPFGLQAGWGLSGELAGTGLFGALRIYGQQWRFNSGLFHWLETYLVRRGMVDSLGVAKTIVAVLFLFMIAGVWLLARKRTGPRAAMRLMALLLMAYVLLTPTLHPWYLNILLVFLPFLTPSSTESGWRWLLAAPWIYLSGALVFSYLTYFDPLAYGELEWVRRLEWLPLLALLLAAGAATVAHRSEILSPESTLT